VAVRSRWLVLERFGQADARPEWKLVTIEARMLVLVLTRVPRCAQMAGRPDFPGLPLAGQRPPALMA
jgi:hypothetical protein